MSWPIRDTITRLLQDKLGIRDPKKVNDVDRAINMILDYKLQTKYKVKRYQATEEEVASIAKWYMKSETVRELFNEDAPLALQQRSLTAEGYAEIGDVIRRVMEVKRKNAIDRIHKKPENGKCAPVCGYCFPRGAEETGTSVVAVSDEQTQPQHDEAEVIVVGESAREEVRDNNQVEPTSRRSNSRDNKYMAVIKWQADEYDRMLKETSHSRVEYFERALAYEKALTKMLGDDNGGSPGLSK